MYSHSTRQRRPPIDRGIKRSVECPCAVRVYYLQCQDIAARSEECSAVLRVPSVGISNLAPTPAEISEAVQEAGASSRVSAEAGSNAANLAAPKLLTVLMTWADTSLWEVCLASLKANRKEVDEAYLLAHPDASTLLLTAPCSSALPHYTIELMTGSINSDGKAILAPLGQMECHQVMPDHSAVLPLRRQGSMDANTALYETSYKMGDPLFVSCTRNC